MIRGKFVTDYQIAFFSRYYDKWILLIKFVYESLRKTTYDKHANQERNLL